RVAGASNDLGALFVAQEDYETALKHFNDSLSIYINIKDKYEMSRVHYNMGIVRQRMMEYDQAMMLFKIAKTESVEMKNMEIVVSAGEGLSTIYREQGKYSLSLEELVESEKLAFSINDMRLVAEIQWLRAKVYQAAGRYEEAVKEANAALSQVEKINARGISYLINTTLGECYLAEKKYEQAQGSFREAIGELEGSRKRIVGAEYERQLFFEQKTAAYHGMVELMLRAERPAEALMYAEKTKARTLVDVLTQGKFNFSGVLTDAERREEKRLNQQIIDLNRSLRNESLNAKPSVEKVNGLTTQLSTARSQLSSFQSRAHSNHPELTAGGTAPGDLQLSELRGVVRSPGTAVLEYVVTEKGVHLFVVTADPVSGRIKIRPHYIAIDRKELVKQVTRFHRSVSERDLVFSGDARLLYDLLVRPAAPDLVGKRVLCVIPDEVLWNIPFQALQGTGDRYLLEDYSLYYAPSLGALKMISPRSTKVAEREFSLLSFANPLVGEKAPVRLEVAQRAGPFAPLPEAEVEANSIRQLFPSGRSRVFVGEAATESSFKAMAAGYKVIHLATHGILDDRHPLYSYVLFSDRDGEENDGMLEAREVVNLDLNADLVVLSACETGRGGIKRGEGVVGLSWAFLAAGAKTTVVSQWKVNSASTARLMVGFYKRMRGQAARPGVTRSEALRQASLDLMKDNRYRHPFYWAGFIIVGRGE
ncbi:MAG: CHAT domain-containing tetratricopeptide repeat protein, partial [Blastocatellia bacterium]